WRFKRDHQATRRGFKQIDHVRILQYGKDAVVRAKGGRWSVRETRKRVLLRPRAAVPNLVPSRAGCQELTVWAEGDSRGPIHRQFGDKLPQRHVPNVNASALPRARCGPASVGAQGEKLDPRVIR